MVNAILEIRRYFLQPEAPNVEEFFRFFRNKVLLIYVASTQLEDAFRLFTVLNDRGMKLRNSDILKTSNLGALKESGASPHEQKQAAQTWEEMEGEFGEDFDAFLAHVRTVLVKEKARLGLLQEFEENIYSPHIFQKDTKQHRKVPPLLKRGRETFEFIKRYRSHYLQVFSGNNHHLENSWEFDNLISVLHDAGLADFWVPPVLHYREVFGEERIVEFLRTGSLFDVPLVAGMAWFVRIGFQTQVAATENPAEEISTRSYGIWKARLAMVAVFVTPLMM